MEQRKRLSDIAEGMKVQQGLDGVQAAARFAPIPRGEYEAVVIGGVLHTARTGTSGYKLTFEVASGEYKGRKVWLDLWFTPAAMPYTKRDMLELGLTRAEQLEQPLPARFICKMKVAIRKNDDGTEYNRVVSFECIGQEPADPFAPTGDK